MVDVRPQRRVNNRFIQNLLHVVKPNNIIEAGCVIRIHHVLFNLLNEWVAAFTLKLLKLSKLCFFSHCF